jgi:ABC-type amino acid transport substrate-binding protein
MKAKMNNFKGNAKFLGIFVVGLLVGAFIGYGLQAFTQGRQALSYVDKIKKRGKLVVGTSADWPPFEYVDKNHNYAGIDIEIAKRIAKELGVSLEIRDMKFAGLIEALKNGDVDIVIADMTPTAEREQMVDFSIPYYTSKGYAVVTLSASTIKAEQDLYGKRVGVQLGTIQEDWANSNLKGKAEVKSYDRVYPEMVWALQRGDIDAMILGDKIAEALVTKEATLKIATYVSIPTIGGAVAVPQGAEDLKFVVNSVIEKLLESGEMQKIFNDEIVKWLGSS